MRMVRWPTAPEWPVPATYDRLRVLADVGPQRYELALGLDAYTVAVHLTAVGERRQHEQSD